MAHGTCQLSFIWPFGMGTHYVAQACLDLVVLLHQPPKCLNYGCVLPIMPGSAQDTCLPTCTKYRMWVFIDWDICYFITCLHKLPLKQEELG